MTRFTIDQERLALLKPDLLLAWQSGTPAHIVDELRQTGYVVETIRTQRNSATYRLRCSASAVSRGRQYHAMGAADEFDAGLKLLERQHAG